MKVPSHFRADIGEPWHSMAKLMSHYGAAIGQIPIGILDKFSEETECYNRKPLYFLPSSDQKAQFFLYEVYMVLDIVYILYQPTENTSTMKACLLTVHSVFSYQKETSSPLGNG
jgi:hypothetical protein